LREKRRKKNKLLLDFLKYKKLDFFFFNVTFKPIAKLIQLGIQMAIVAFLQKPRKRLGQGQCVGYIQRGTKGHVATKFDIAYLNNTIEFGKVGYGERRVRGLGD